MRVHACPSQRDSSNDTGQGCTGVCGRGVQGCAAGVCGRGVQGCAAGVYRGVRQGCTGVCGRGVQACAAGVYMGVRQVCMWVWQGLQGCAARVCGRDVQVCAGVVGVYRGVRQGCTGVYRTGVYRGVQQGCTGLCSRGVQGCTGQGSAVYRSAPCVYEESTADRFLHIALYIMLMSGSSRRISNSTSRSYKWDFSREKSRTKTNYLSSVNTGNFERRPQTK